MCWAIAWLRLWWRAGKDIRSVSPRCKTPEDLATPACPVVSANHRMLRSATTRAASLFVVPVGSGAPGLGPECPARLKRALFGESPSAGAFGAAKTSHLLPLWQTQSVGAC